jgi:hypothetical protein
MRVSMKKKNNLVIQTNPIFCTSHWTNSGTKGLEHGIVAGLLLCQANIPKKTLCTSNTKFPFKTVYFLGVSG